jgi:hypothetical protein
MSQVTNLFAITKCNNYYCFFFNFLVIAMFYKVKECNITSSKIIKREKVEKLRFRRFEFGKILEQTLQSEPIR